MIALVVVLAVVVAYLFIGFRFAAPMFVGRAMRAYVRDWPTLAEDAERLERERREMTGLGIVLAIVWPAYLLIAMVGSALTPGIMRRAPRTDLELRREAAAKDRRIADQAAYIARLERETGIKS